MYHVLLVDDDMTNRIGIRSLLDWEELGFDVVGAVENGKAALEFLETATVHLIITDMKMPIMGGD
ncbi:MAG: response regulator [Clostridium sp.]|nr:response regulator [Clostridium sp.]